MPHGHCVQPDYHPAALQDEGWSKPWKSKCMNTIPERFLVKCQVPCTKYWPTMHETNSYKQDIRYLYFGAILKAPGFRLESESSRLFVSDQVTSLQTSTF